VKAGDFMKYVVATSPGNDEAGWNYSFGWNGMIILPTPLGGLAKSGECLENF